MIISRKILEYVTMGPFRPFLIKMASGQTFEIRHLEMILFGKTSVRIYTPIGSDQNEKWIDASLKFLETIEPSDISVPQMNG